MYKERCPHARNTSGYCKEVDDYIDGSDLCTLVDKWCLLESGDTCEIYNEFLDELSAEEAAEAQAQVAVDNQREYEEWKFEQQQMEDIARQHEAELSS